MINPQECVSRITQNDPQLAVSLFDFLLWASSPDAAKSPEFDEVLDLLYLKIPDFRVHRDCYVKRRAA